VVGLRASRSILQSVVSLERGLDKIVVPILARSDKKSSASKGKVE
jgi:hypothetical protein